MAGHLFRQMREGRGKSSTALEDNRRIQSVTTIDSDVPNSLPLCKRKISLDSLSCTTLGLPNRRFRCEEMGEIRISQLGRLSTIIAMKGRFGRRDYNNDNND